MSVLSLRSRRLDTPLRLFTRFDTATFGGYSTVHQQVHVIVLAVHFDQLRLEVGAYLGKDGGAVGIDVGVARFARLSDGTFYAPLKASGGMRLLCARRNGALGPMSVTMLTYPKNLEGSITILGEKGTVRVGGVAVNDIQLWEFDEPRDYDAQVKAANYETTSVYGFGHPLYYKNVIDVMRGQAEPETDGREGLKSLELLIAAYLSARDGNTVSLPLEY
jgi:predicted dehydrogenase